MVAIAELSARLYLDHNADPQVAHDLGLEGFDVVVAQDVGMDRASDEDHLIFASAHGRVLFTHDLDDFQRIAAEWYASGRTHAGIIIANQPRDISYGTMIQRILALLNSVSADEFNNLVRCA